MDDYSNHFITTLSHNRPRLNTVTTRRYLDRLDTATAGRSDRETVELAFALLTASEPHRVPDLIASLAEGRVDDVARHLAAYYTPERIDAHHRTVADVRRR